MVSPLTYTVNQAVEIKHKMFICCVFNAKANFHLIVTEIVISKHEAIEDVRFEIFKHFNYYICRYSVSY